jgi:hypothetical protein
MDIRTKLMITQKHKKPRRHDGACERQSVNFQMQSPARWAISSKCPITKENYVAVRPEFGNILSSESAGRDNGGSGDSSGSKCVAERRGLEFNTSLNPHLMRLNCI